MKTLVTIVEVPPFGRMASSCLSEAELDEFKYFIALNPQAGVRIRGTGGLRKVRWARADKGKSGGVRVIYYYHDDRVPLFFLAIYRKAAKESLSAAEKSKLRQLTSKVVSEYRGEKR